MSPPPFRLVDDEGFDVVLVSGRVARQISGILRAAVDTARRVNGVTLGAEVTGFMRELDVLAAAHRAARPAQGSRSEHAAEHAAEHVEQAERRGGTRDEQSWIDSVTVTTSTAASELGVTARAVTRLISRQRLSVTGETPYRIHRWSLDQLIAERRQNTNETDEEIET